VHKFIARRNLFNLNIAGNIKTGIYCREKAEKKNAERQRAAQSTPPGGKQTDQAVGGT
jgi:hypothetical protein